MIAGPVFVAELRRTSRRARYYAARAALGGLLLAVAWASFQSARGATTVAPRRASILAMQIFGEMVAVQALAVGAIVPALVAGTLAEQRARGTLRDVLASDFSSAEIVLGTLAARMLHVFIFLAVGLPIASVLTLLGGIAPADVALAYAATACVAVLLGGIAILASVVARGPREAIFAAYGLSAFWLTLSPALDGPARVTFPAAYPALAPIANALRDVNPLMTMRDGPEAVLCMGGFSAIAGAAASLLAVALLRPASRRIAEATGAHRSRRLRGFRLRRRPPVGDDPMLWKETQARRSSGMLGTLGRGALLLIGLGAALYLISAAIPAMALGRAEEFNEEVRGIGTLFYVTALIAATAGAAGSITSEREDDTWTSLLATPLPAAEILRAKRAGADRRARPLFRVTLLAWTLGLLCGAVHPLAFVAALPSLWVYRRAAVALGVFVSLHARSTGRAYVIALGLTAFLHVGYLLCCLPIGAGSPFVALGCSPLMVYVAPASYRDVANFFGRGGSDWAAAYVPSLTAYAILAFALNGMAEEQFDDLEDRPASGRVATRWPPTPPPPPPSPPHDASPEGDPP